MRGGVGLQSQALVESKELHIAGLAGSEEDKGTALSPHASCAATAVYKGAADQNKRTKEVSRSVGWRARHTH